jgi:hypothetical protein
VAIAVTATFIANTDPGGWRWVVTGTQADCSSHEQAFD